MGTNKLPNRIRARLYGNFPRLWIENQRLCDGYMNLARQNKRKKTSTNNSTKGACGMQWLGSSANALQSVHARAMSMTSPLNPPKEQQATPEYSQINTFQIRIMALPNQEPKKPKVTKTNTPRHKLNNWAAINIISNLFLAQLELTRNRCNQSTL